MPPPPYKEGPVEADVKVQRVLSGVEHKGFPHAPSPLDLKGHWSASNLIWACVQAFCLIYNGSYGMRKTFTSEKTSVDVYEIEIELIKEKQQRANSDRKEDRSWGWGI